MVHPPPLSTAASGCALIALVAGPAGVQAAVPLPASAAVLVAGVSAVLLIDGLMALRDRAPLSGDAAVGLVAVVLALLALPQLGLSGLFLPKLDATLYAGPKAAVITSFAVGLAVALARRQLLAAILRQLGTVEVPKTAQMWLLAADLLLSIALAWALFLSLSETVLVSPFERGMVLSILSLGLWMFGLRWALTAAFAALGRSSSRWRPELAVVVAVVVVAAIFFARPSAAEASFAALWLPFVVVLAALTVRVTGVAALNMTLSFALCLASGLFVLEFVPHFGGAVDPVAALALMALPFVANVGISKGRVGDGGHEFTVPPALAKRAPLESAIWIAQLDLSAREVRFVNETPFLVAGETKMSFEALFAEGASGGALDLLREVQRPAGEATAKITLRLPVRHAGAALTARTVEAEVVERQGAQAWLVLCDVSQELEVRARLSRTEARLAETILREERLLSVAAHELRTPVAVLSMLGEEMREGTLWADIDDSFSQSLERMLAILDDLRADGPTEGARGAGQVFAPSDLAQRLLDTYRAAAQAHGMSIELQLGDQAHELVRGDYGRVYLALSKVLHNAILHSKGTLVRLSCLVTQTSARERDLLWSVADDGIGLPVERRGQLFEAFDGPAHGATGPGLGLGLYTARKAVEVLGGRLTLQDSAVGCLFVLSHPAQVAVIELPPRQEAPSPVVAEPLDKTARRALLVEDNRLVGEMTCARLQRLFSVVDWAETGPDGLTLWREGAYDIVFVDQLLPGLHGSEVVREMRKTDPSVPVIGVTASTMGQECRALEEAGATLALEKPLTFEQIRSIVAQYLPDLAVPMGEDEAGAPVAELG